MSVREAGRRGGEACRDNHEPGYHAELARRRGKQLMATRGRAYFVEMARKRWAKDRDVEVVP